MTLQQRRILSKRLQRQGQEGKRKRKSQRTAGRLGLREATLLLLQPRGLQQGPMSVRAHDGFRQGGCEHGQAWVESPVPCEVARKLTRPREGQGQGKEEDRWHRLLPRLPQVSVMQERGEVPVRARHRGHCQGDGARAGKQAKEDLTTGPMRG